MSVPEPPSPTSLRALVGRGETARSVVAGMGEKLPAAGVAEPALRGRGRFLTQTYKLLDRRILEYAATCLDQEVARPLARCLAAFADVRTAAASTLAHPGTSTVVELGVGQPLTAVQQVTVDLRVDGKRLVGTTFVLDVTAELAETSLAVEGGAVEELIWTACTLSASLSLKDFAPPLWKPDPVALPALHLPVQPPLRVPLVPVPRGGPAGVGVAPVGTTGL